MRSLHRQHAALDACDCPVVHDVLVREEPDEEEEEEEDDDRKEGEDDDGDGYSE